MWSLTKLKSELMEKLKNENWKEERVQICFYDCSLTSNSHPSFRIKILTKRQHQHWRWHKHKDVTIINNKFVSSLAGVMLFKFKNNQNEINSEWVGDRIGLQGNNRNVRNANIFFRLFSGSGFHYDNNCLIPTLPSCPSPSPSNLVDLSIECPRPG